MTINTSTEAAKARAAWMRSSDHPWAKSDADLLDALAAERDTAYADLAALLARHKIVKIAALKSAQGARGRGVDAVSIKQEVMYAVLRTSSTPCECGSLDSISVEFVTGDRDVAERYIAERNNNRSPWMPTFDIEEVETR